MKSASLIVDPNQAYQSLKDLSSRLKPRAGLELPGRGARTGPGPHPDDGAVKITQDELGNTYDRVGGGYSNCKP